MAAQAPPPNVPQSQQATGNGNKLCDHCHQKPKFSKYDYCSKTCASQASSMCNHCQKKPKFQNFDFCGKTCASLAQQPGVNSQPQQSKLAPSKQNSSGKKAPNSQPNASTGLTNSTIQMPQNATPPDPVELAKLVVDQIPFLKALLSSPNAPRLVFHHGPPPGDPTPAPPATSSPSTSPAPQVPDSNSKSPATASHSVQNGNSTSGGVPSVNVPAVAVAASTSNAQCRIPGCGKPVYVDANGQSTSEYCSTSHRQEAVSSGLVEPCIMCLDLPQSGEDYFCGRACKEEALDKNLPIPVRD